MGKQKLSERIREAQAATAEQLAELITPCAILHEKQFTFRLVLASQLTKPEREAIWQIADDNMRDLSINSSMGWSPGPKKRQLFHAKSRLILVHNESDDFIGFSMFRFDAEDDLDVLYCYEVQLVEGSRGFGIGKQLIQFLVAIGNKWDMESIMLTALKANPDARRFYIANGFQVDEYSPDEPGCDYEVLSMPLGNHPG